MTKQKVPSTPTIDPQHIHILIADDNASHAETMQEAMERVNYKVSLALSGREALNKIQEELFDIVITDLVMSEVDGLELLREAKEKNESTEVILITGYASVESAVEAMKQGALDYMEKPINLKVLRAKVAKAVEKVGLYQSNQELRKQLEDKFKFEGIVGNAPKMHRLLEKLISVASAGDTTVLITGENGTGKELVAQTLHNNSSRKGQPFVAINCAGIPESLLESELFGTVPGAFTNAKARKGKVEYAHRGTLFLDEIGDMASSLQAKLLRVLEQKEITRLGSNESLKVDVRFLAATNKELHQEVEEGRFRQDLYYRLRVIPLHVPPLRERQEDIPLLVDYFLRDYAEKHKKKIRGISPKVRELFFRHKWPGNVRELKNCIESMVITGQGETLEMEEVPEWIFQSTQEAELNIPAGYSMDEYEKEIIKVNLKLTRSNRAEASKILKIGERTLYRKLKKYNLF